MGAQRSWWNWQRTQTFGDSVAGLDHLRHFHLNEARPEARLRPGNHLERKWWSGERFWLNKTALKWKSQHVCLGRGTLEGKEELTNARAHWNTTSLHIFGNVWRRQEIQRDSRSTVSEDGGAP